ncbi:RNA-directed DNA polymerase, LTR Retrotransposon [Trachipleistophora hominis]|uniref:RNA-directed DNA polymerase, LTR Retrotransposon n=1 Tax=Trachipleistophora hominis TaxID=72359 RepID=L7JXM5_TRAHO|nr:RNA-directed DNA polymerase, LTR Retrotransposon [Trachipleistophora hominis]
MEEIPDVVTRMLRAFNVEDSNKSGDALKIDMRHKIDLIDERKYAYSKPYQTSLKEAQIIKSEVYKLLELEIIRESKSQHLSPVLLVVKKDGTTRFCVDYRKLNLNTIKQPYPIPNMEQLMKSIVHSNCYSTLNLRSGYH